MTSPGSVYEGSATHRHLLRAIRDGESAFLVGPPGCGMSTLLQRIDSTDQATFQSIHIDLARHVAPASMLAETIRKAGAEPRSESVQDLLEELVKVLTVRHKKTPVILLDQCHEVEDDYQISLLPSIRAMQTQRKRKPELPAVSFVVAGSMNPQELSTRIGTSPVENQANRIHMPELAFEDIDFVIRAEIKRLERSDEKMPDEVRRRLYGLAENDLRLLCEILRWLPEEVLSYEDPDQQILQAATNALASSGSLEFHERLHEVVELPQHRRLMARVLLSRSPRAETSWYHDSFRAAVDLRAAGILVLSRHTKILRFRNEAVVLALSKQTEFNKYLVEEMRLDRNALKEFYRSFHMRGGHSLYVAFRRCHEVEVALRSHIAGIALGAGGEQLLERILGEIRSHDGGDERALRALRENHLIDDNACREFTKLLRNRRSTLREVLVARFGATNGDGAASLTDLLNQLTLRETADILDKLAASPELQASFRDPRESGRMSGVAARVREFADLRNRVAHFKQFSLRDQQMLRTMQQQVLDGLGAV